MSEAANAAAASEAVVDHSAHTEVAADHGAAHVEPTLYGLEAYQVVSIAMLVLVAVMIWKKVPGMITGGLDAKIAAIRAQLDEAKALGADKIATGHYARVRERDGSFQLVRGADAGKDQTYFLHQLGQAQLAATLFPIGHLPKSEVRALAAGAGFATAAKKDSTGICFIGERDFRDFLGQYIPAKAGEIRSVDGHRVGEHSGVFYYTLGQREGLHIGGIKGRPAAPWFVVGKDTRRNILYVDQGIESQWLHSRALRSETAHWVAGTAPAAEFRCTAKTRYRQQDVACEVRVLTDGTLDVRFDEPQRAVTPGQSLVLYADDVCLGGAVIAETDAPMEIRLRQEITA